MKHLPSILLFLLCHVVHGEDVKVQYRLLGLFQPDRVDDLRRQASTLPAESQNAKSQAIEVKLVDVNYDTTMVTFSYDSATTFKKQPPEKIRERIDQLLRQASRGAFSIAEPSTLKPDQLKQERIAVAGHDCKGCDFGLYRAVASIDGVERVIASFKQGHVTAWIDPRKTNRAGLLAALKKKEVDVVDADAAEKTEGKK